MDFVIDNYLWFVLGAVILLMLIIGYCAEKTDFGKKPFISKVKKNDSFKDTSLSKDESNIVTDMNETGINDMLNRSTVKDDAQSILNQPITESLIDESEQSSDISNIVPLEEDLNVPFGDVEVKPQFEEVSEITTDTEPLQTNDDIWKF